MAIGLTISEFLRDPGSCGATLDPGLVVLLEHIQNACRRIASATAEGSLAALPGWQGGINVQCEKQEQLDVQANDIFVGTCERAGQLCGIVSEEMEGFYPIPSCFKAGSYLLVCDPLDGSSNIDVNVTIGSIFSILQASQAPSRVSAADCLQPGARQVCAGYALYGPCSMLVLTLGRGVYGFTLSRKLAAYVLTHPDMRIPETAREFAINVSNERFWEPPVRQYIKECTEGRAGPRGADFNMRWIASMVAEVHRILIRGGIYMYPRDNRDRTRAGRLRLMYEANPMAMLVEQAGGAASTGRERILDIAPESLHQRIPVILGARQEVERLVRYHEDYDRGDDLVFNAPLFRERTLFRTA